MIEYVRRFAQRLLRARRTRSLNVLDEAPLFGGAAVHVVEVAGRRFVLASSSGAICLLAQLDVPCAGAASGGGAAPRRVTSMQDRRDRNGDDGERSD